MQYIIVVQEVSRLARRVNHSTNFFHSGNGTNREWCPHSSNITDHVKHLPPIISTILPRGQPAGLSSSFPSPSPPPVPTDPTTTTTALPWRASTRGRRHGSNAATARCKRSCSTTTTGSATKWLHEQPRVRSTAHFWVRTDRCHSHPPNCDAEAEQADTWEPVERSAETWRSGDSCWK